MKVFQLALLALCAAAAMAHTAGKKAGTADAAVVDGADRVDVSGSGSGSGSARIDGAGDMDMMTGKKGKKGKKGEDMAAASPGLRVGSGSGKGKGGKLQATSGASTSPVPCLAHSFHNCPFGPFSLHPRTVCHICVHSLHES
jgi:hypothetical protein